MEATKIISALWKRNEQALAQIQLQYGSYCRAIAIGILKDEAFSEECLNDTLLQAWNSIPPQRPRSLKAWLGAVCRNTALSRWRTMHAEKRGKSEIPLVLDELLECLPVKDQFTEQFELKDILEAFLYSQTEQSRYIFLRRYWYLDSIAEIAEKIGKSEGAIRVQLHRLRKQLQQTLEQEGIQIEK